MLSHPWHSAFELIHMLSGTSLETIQDGHYWSYWNKNCISTVKFLLWIECTLQISSKSTTSRFIGTIFSKEQSSTSVLTAAHETYLERPSRSNESIRTSRILKLQIFFESSSNTKLDSAQAYGLNFVVTQKLDAIRALFIPLQFILHDVEKQGSGCDSFFFLFFFC